jgi:hypothetical protein
MTNFVRVGKSPTGGNGLFATCDIVRGNPIYLTPRVMVAVPFDNLNSQVCSSCYATASDYEGALEEQELKLQRCNACKEVYYCGKVPHSLDLPKVSTASKSLTPADLPEGGLEARS